VRNVSFRWIGSVFLCFSFVTLSAKAFANDYYVGPTGNDSNDGSQSRPWKTIQHCVSSFSLGSNGAVCHVAAGSYTTGVDVNRGGSSQSARFVLRCDPGMASANAAVDQCKITGTISFANIGIFVEANNVDIIGFDVGNNANMGAGIIGANSNSSVHLIGNYVHDLGSNVFNTAGAIRGCPENGAIGAGSSDARAIGNIIKNFGINPAPSGCNVAQGIYMGNGVVQNNLVINVPVGGVQMSIGCNSVISNNTIIGVKDGIIIENGTGCLGHNTVANNYLGNFTNGIFYTSGSAKCTSSATNLFSHNMTDGSGADFSSGPFSCDALSPSQMVHQDPSSFFVNYQANGSGDYHLKSGSLGIGAGSTGCVTGGMSPCTPTIDLAGVARPSSLSLGVFESELSASSPAAPTGLTAVVQ
jgi:hypothetical protein